MCCDVTAVSKALKRKETQVILYPEFKHKICIFISKLKLSETITTLGSNVYIFLPNLNLLLTIKIAEAFTALKVVFPEVSQL